MTDHTPFIQKEVTELIIGTKLLGEGQYRKVYEHAYNPHWVVKVESLSKNFANPLEWEAWTQLQFTRISGWLAPCLHISPAGGVLIQAKTSPIWDLDELPKRVPALFTDLKRENWGKLKGRIVCHDYGNLLLGKGFEMVKAKWVR